LEAELAFLAKHCRLAGVYVRNAALCKAQKHFGKFLKQLIVAAFIVFNACKLRGC
jgi:hypothetical protein